MIGQRLPGGLFLLGLLLASPTAEAAGPRLQSMNQLRLHGIQRQTLDYSCGAAALAILLERYLGEPVGEEQVLADIVLRLSEFEVRERVRAGFSLLDLKSTALHLGYSAEGVLLPAQAVHALDGPVLILLHHDRLNHFVVLKGVRQGHAFLADPARGHRRIPLFELFRQWRGETLIVGRAAASRPEPPLLALPGARHVAPEIEVVRTLLAPSSR
ncbi:MULTISPECIES: C39 family peptidase [Pseudomonas]|uniref:C39 family peptidase n=1 Tax=Pseudomonas TaxID=286 RepID=UPI00235F8766|nr:cysteine peptidase family C39 domain-containing protein [Pseudomonas asplenii]